MWRKTLILITLFTAFSLGFYLLFSQQLVGLGFPLDDAWIYQTYTRNLAQRGEWAFLPGQPSAGATGPLWVLSLAPGYYLGLPYKMWTYLLGWGLLCCLGVMGSLAWRSLAPEHLGWAPWVGVFFAFEWHFVWAAGAGMETLLFIVLVALVFVWMVSGWKRWFLLGVVVGLATCTRPDGVTLLGPVVFMLVFSPSSWREKFNWTVMFLSGFILLFCPYLLFNRAVSGVWWPSTYYAKQLEYSISQQALYWRRWIKLFSLPLVGVGVLLLPGWLWSLCESIRKKKVDFLAGSLWMLGYISVYAWRLPVTYQHGRYLMPVLPVLCLWGLSGLAKWIKTGSAKFWGRVLLRAWISAMILVLGIFWYLGAQAYARDVALIETEMVDAALWVKTHTGVQEVVAAHDIGAIGYFSDRELVDMAGLVSVEVIPFLRDEERLAEYLDRQGVEYLVTFPGWYPKLVAGKEVVYSTQGVFSPAMGGENMVVYRWRRGD
ncbi:MAG: hypothetical protein AB1345_09625 [Chloroflexota bacterium]